MLIYECFNFMLLFKQTGELSSRNQTTKAKMYPAIQKVQLYTQIGKSLCSIFKRKTGELFPFPNSSHTQKCILSCHCREGNSILSKPVILSLQEKKKKKLSYLTMLMLPICYSNSRSKKGDV